MSEADIRIDGNRAWDIQVINEEFYERIFRDGRLGLGEAYVDGWWECERIDEMITKLFRSGIEEKMKRNLRVVLYGLRAKIFNLGKKRKALEIAKQHYDLGNTLFENILDKRMIYSSGYWKEKITLDEAQERKLDLICTKIGLRKGMKVLDIGCGWGGFVKYAAERYGAEMVGITVSKEQVEFARKSCTGLPVEIKLQDYRDINGKYDRIVSMEMFEHVGCKNYRRFMEIAHSALADDGLFLLHTYGGNKSEISGINQEPFIIKYLLPNSVISSIKQIGQAIEGLFIMEDWENIGVHNDRTVMAWLNNFENNWHKIKDLYGERFHRMWKYGFQICAGACRARYVHVWHIILSKKGILGGYKPVREIHSK